MTGDGFTESRCWGGRPVAPQIAAAEPRSRVVVTGVICSTEVTAEHGPASYACVIDDGTGELGLLFLGRRGVAGMVVGTRCTVEGTANLEGSRLVVWNPLYRIEPSERCGEPSE